VISYWHEMFVNFFRAQLLLYVRCVLPFNALLSANTVHLSVLYDLKIRRNYILKHHLTDWYLQFDRMSLLRGRNWYFKQYLRGLNALKG